MTTPIADRGYTHPEVLVDTDWVAAHLDDPNVRIVESDEDIMLYGIGHIPGAIELDWVSDLQDSVRRDFLSREQFSALLGAKGISNDHTVVFYGDKNNWYACYTFWLFKYYGHEDCRVMDGGRAAWDAENRRYSRDVPSYPAVTYTAKEPNSAIRAFRDDVLRAVNTRSHNLVDVRSPQEYSGEVMHMAGYPQEGAQRAGHITGAQSIPWGQAANADGTFKSAVALKAIYEGKGITEDRPTIAYCRIGERASHTWFALHYLLGHEDVANYDGSWTEWGSMVGMPVEKGAAPA